MFSFRGQAFGILLGVVPQFGKDPTREQVIPLLAGVGFVLLDDVADFLGEEAAAKFTEKIHERYDQKPEEPRVVAPEKPLLVDAKGEPLESPPPDKEPIPIAARPKPDAEA